MRILALAGLTVALAYVLIGVDPGGLVSQLDANVVRPLMATTGGRLLLLIGTPWLFLLLLPKRRS